MTATPLDLDAIKAHREGFVRDDDLGRSMPLTRFDQRTLDCLDALIAEVERLRAEAQMAKQ